MGSVRVCHSWMGSSGAATFFGASVILRKDGGMNIITRAEDEEEIGAKTLPIETTFFELGNCKLKDRKNKNIQKYLKYIFRTIPQNMYS